MGIVANKYFEADKALKTFKEETQIKNILLKATVKMYKQLAFILEDQVSKDFFKINDEYHFNQSFKLLYKCSSVGLNYGSPRISFTINKEDPTAVDLEFVKSAIGISGYSGIGGFTINSGSTTTSNWYTSGTTTIQPYINIQPGILTNSPATTTVLSTSSSTSSSTGFIKISHKD